MKSCRNCKYKHSFVENGKQKEHCTNDNYLIHKWNIRDNKPYCKWYEPEVDINEPKNIVYKYEMCTLQDYCINRVSGSSCVNCIRMNLNSHIKDNFKSNDIQEFFSNEDLWRMARVCLLKPNTIVEDQEGTQLIFTGRSFQIHKTTYNENETYVGMVIGDRWRIVEIQDQDNQDGSL